MALTKHQKLARGLKALLDALDQHHQKTANILNALQFHFYETYSVINPYLKPEQVLQSIMKTHRCGLKIFSPNEELRTAAQSFPFIGFILHPIFFFPSRVLENLADVPKEYKQIIPWEVKILLPSEALAQLKKSMTEAILYCSSASEMSEWIDWFEQENKSSTLVNQLLAIGNYYEEQAQINKNLNQLALQPYRDTVLNYYKKNDFLKAYKTLEKIEFVPKEQTTIAQAYKSVTDCLKTRKKRHFEDFQRFWRDELERLIFAGLNLTKGKQRAHLQKYFPQKLFAQKKQCDIRWKTGFSIDRQTAATFIQYFASRFLENPLKNQSDGEIVLLIWVMIYISLEPDKIQPIKRLLELTTADVSDRILSIDNYEIEFSCGLADLINEYTRKGPLQRQQKLFPNLTIDNLEDRFHRASEELLPPGTIPVLPEAFLIFPHSHDQLRMPGHIRRDQQKHPAPIYHDPISRNELKRQLIEKSKQKTS